MQREEAGWWGEQRLAQSLFVFGACPAGVSQHSEAGGNLRNEDPNNGLAVT